MPNPDKNHSSTGKAGYDKYNKYLTHSIRGNKSIGNSVKDLRKFQEQLANLNRLIDGCYARDIDGNYIPLNKQQLDKLKATYQLCDYYASRVAKNASKRKVTGTLITQLHKIIKEDQEYVHSLEVGDTFPEKFRRHVVSLDSAVLEQHKVGGQVSARHPITYKDENGQTVSGFFTQDTSINATEEEVQDFRERYAQAQGDEAQALLDELEDNKPLGLAIAGGIAGIELRSNVSDRNCAMTRIANFLGLGRLLADSHSMTIVDKTNGTKMNGVFMTTSKGTTYENLLFMPGYVGAVAALDRRRNPSAYIDLKDGGLKKDIADLQILDYICGSTDRHQGNMTYTFEDTEAERPHMIGIQGIDNDMSMGLLVPNEKVRAQSLPALRDMGVISESVAKKVNKMTKEDLTFVLKGLKLSSREIDAAWNRTKQIKKWIKKTQRYGEHTNYREDQLIIIPDDQFGEIDFKSFCDRHHEGNYYNDIYRLPGVLRDDRNKDIKKEENYQIALKYNPNARKPKKVLNYEKEEKISYIEADLTRLALTKDVRDMNQKTVRDFMDKLMNLADNNLDTRHDPYKAVYRTAEQIDRWYERYQEGMAEEKELKELFQNAAQACQDYINDHDPWFADGKKRQRTITELLEFIGTQGIMLDDYYEYVSKKIDKATEPKDEAELKSNPDKKKSTGMIHT